MKNLITALAFVCSASMATATTVDVDLGSASSGTGIDVAGASFAGLFDGQSLTGNAVSGSVNGPLTLLEDNFLAVAFFGGSNSILPSVSNGGPLAMLLDSVATSLDVRMGFFNGGTVDINFFDSLGNVVNTIAGVGASGGSGYENFSFGGFGEFAGVQFFNNNDPAGLRYQNFSYEAVDGMATVPLPAGGLLLITALGGMALTRRKKAA